MPYLSQLLRAPVKDSSDTVVGRVKDFLIKPVAGSYTPVLFMLIERKKYGQQCIPYEFVANLSREEVTLKSLITKIEEPCLVDEMIRLERDILDEQIVDVAGARVVRVNDLRLGLFENSMCVLGIDVSFKGILRRLGLAWGDFFDVFKVNLIDWRKAQPVKGALKLDTISKDLTKLHPADLANIIEDLTVKHGGNLVDSLDSEAAAQVIEEMDPELQKTIIHYLGPERAADIVDRMSVDETVDLLQMLPKDEAKKFLSYLQTAKSKKVEKLIAYPIDTAGGQMTTEYVAVRPDSTVEQTIQEVQKASPHLRSLLYVYVIDKSGDLLGSTSLRTLLVSRPGQTMREIMKVFPEGSVLTVDSKIDAIVKVMTKYNLYVAAVLERGNTKLVGVVTIDDVMRHLVPNA